MSTGTITVQGIVAALPYGSDSIGPLTVSSATANGTVQTLILANGDNTITVPTNPTCTAVLIVFNSASTTVKKIKGIGADTGFTTSHNGLALLSFDTSPMASFIINSSAVDTGLSTYIYFL
jgi:hypothetical protein